MPNIGFWAVAGAGGEAAGAYELISTTYGTGSSGTITFSSIPQTYKHLQIRWVVRTTRTDNTNDGFRVRFNNDTGANYRYHSLSGTGSGVFSGDSGAGATFISGGTISTNLTASGIHVPGVMDILDYASTSKNKTTRTLTGRKDDFNEVAFLSGLWLNTAAVTSITLTMFSGPNWTATSRFSLYGIRG